jgi:hypothetical protein
MLLNSGHLHMYRHRWARDRLVADLTSSGYPMIGVDLSTCVDADTVRDAFIAAVPDWPAGYGRGSWAGFNDGLTDHLLHRERPLVVVVITGFDRCYSRGPDDSLALLDLLAGVARWHLLFGRRLICLIETDDPDLSLPTLGAEHVGWNRHEWLIAHRTGARHPPWIAQSNEDR